MANDIEIKVRASTDGLDATLDNAKKKVGTLADAAKVSGASMASVAADVGQASAQSYNRLAALIYANEVERLNAAARVGRITEAEKTQALREGLAERLAQEQSYYQKALQLAGANAAQHQKLEAGLAIAGQKYRNDMQRLDDQVLQRSVASWRTALGTIEGAWDSQLKGLLSGTTNWATAMRAIVQDLVIQIIKEFEKAALAKAALSLASAGLDLGTGGIGGAIFTGLTKLVGFDVGAWSIPRDMPAMVHAGEMVIPAGAAEQFRSVLSVGNVSGGGGTTHNWNITAVDARSFASALNDSSSYLYKMIQQGVRNGALKTA